MREFPKIVFYGTPAFAVASLDSIVKEGFNVIAVVTAADKPAGRGLKTMSSDVKKYALEHNLKVLQPLSLKNKEFLDELYSLKPDLQVIVAFRRLPAEVWKFPPLGTFNLHASLLPKYRGAAPVNYAVMNGETETGVTTFFLQEEIDTGHILFSEKVKIGKDETAGELHDVLKEIGSAIVIKTINAILNKDVKPVPQDEVKNPGALEFKAPKIHKEDCRININRSVFDVYNQIRGLSPYPGAFIVTKGADSAEYLIKIYNAVPVISSHTNPIGTLVTDGKTYLNLILPDGFISITKLQLAGRKTMETAEFLRGFGRYFVETP